MDAGIKANDIAAVGLHQFFSVCVMAVACAGWRCSALSKPCGSRHCTSSAPWLALISSLTNDSARMGVWVHNTNCLEATLEVAPGKGDIDQLLTGVLQVGSQAHKFKTLSRADLNDFLRKNPNAKQGVAVVKMDGAGKYDKFELGADDLPNGLKFEDEGLGRLIDKSTGTRYEYAVLIDPSSWSGQSLGTNLASRLSQARYVKLENSYFTKNGTRVFVDRKFDTTSMSNAALKYKPLDQLFRLALAAKSNPGMRFAIEVSKDGKNALPAFTKLLDFPVAGRLFR